jgi:adenylate kinase family enzyme
MKRVLVLGNSCAGKTTFAKKLSEQLNSKHVELDALFWEANWTEADSDVFRSRVSKALDSELWIVDGNYKSKIKDIVWPHADAFVWLDPPLLTVLVRFFLRSFGRSFRRELLWGGCRESLRNSIFRRDSLLMWILTTHSRKSIDYVDLLKNPPPGTTVYRLRTGAQIDEFFRTAVRRGGQSINPILA